MRKKILCIAFLACALALAAAVFWSQRDRRATTDGWIYYSTPDGMTDEKGEDISRRLYRINEETGEKQCLYKDDEVHRADIATDRYYVYFCIRNNLYRMDADGQNRIKLYQGNGKDKYAGAVTDWSKEGKWIYFWSFDDECYMRVDTDGKECEVFYMPEYQMTTVFSFVVNNGYFYHIYREGARRGIRSINIKTGEKTDTLELDTGMEVPEYDKNPTRFELAEFGDNLALVYLSKGQSKIVYTKTGKAITEKTKWEEFRIPEMKENSCYPPVLWSDFEWTGIIMQGMYQFHGGQVYYLNADYQVCSRAISGNPSEMIVYEESGPKEEPYRFFTGGRLFFGKKKFYYQYCIYKDTEFPLAEIETGDYLGEIEKIR